MARLLIVDDDPQQLDIWKVLLGDAGHQIHAAATLEEATRVLPQTEPDILIMDLRIPRLEDGLALIRRAAEQPKRPRIVVLSGWPSDLYDRPEERMVDLVLTKPVRVHALLDVLARLSVSLKADSGS